MAEYDLFQSKDLSSLNSFGLAVKAERYFALDRIEQIITVHAALKGQKCLLLGGGSNFLFTQDPEEAVIAMRIKGITICEDGEDVHLHVGAGENWHNFTEYCVDRGYGGIENLSLIPGQVGTAPVQNIGAYGVEVREVITYVDAFDTQHKEMVRLKNEECGFGYRDSIFKSSQKDRFWITAVGFQLSKSAPLHTAYGAIRNQLQAEGAQEPSLVDVASAVIHIRKGKLPDPNELGNAGSFFKNPVLSTERSRVLLNKYPNAPHYPASDGFKWAAGWMIEQAGWKGHRRDTHGVHDRQALVLVNYGGATGKEIFDLSRDIQKDVEKKFGVTLEREVNVYL
jgi:UDP-N-acetylmuramate dehydrogenase